MFLVIDDRNRVDHAEWLNKMYQLRYRVFVEQMGWDLPCGKSGYERDQFDTEHTRYLLMVDDDSGALLASGRFNPTQRPHLMSEVFPHQCNISGVPKGEHIWEYTRYVFDFEAIGKDRFRDVRASFGVAQTELAILTGMTEISWLSTQEIYGHLIQFWPSEPLGTPIYYPKEDSFYIAALSNIGDEALQRMQTRLGRYDRLLTNCIPQHLLAA